MNYFVEGLQGSGKSMIKRAGIEDASVLADLAIQMWTDHMLQKRTVDLFCYSCSAGTVCCLYHPEERFISVPREPKHATI